MKNPHGKTGINSQTCNFSEKSLHHRRLPVNILELSALLQEGLTWAPFFLIKLRAVYYRVATLLEFFKTASFRYIFQKVSAVSSLNSHVAFWTLWVWNFTERNSIINIFLRNFQTIFCNISFLLKRQITWKIIWKLGVKPRERDNSSAILRWVGNNRGKREGHLVILDLEGALSTKYLTHV